MLEHLTKENFNDFIKNNSLCVVDFWATWCGPCRMLTPVLEKINEENGYAIGKINRMVLGITNKSFLKILKK